MRRIDRKFKRHQRSRARYELKHGKRRGSGFAYYAVEKRREQAKLVAQFNKKPLEHPAPSNFSLSDNSEAVLEYFQDAESILHSGDNVRLDISNVEKMSTDTVALMIANINSRDFLGNAHVFGNAPKNPELKKLFTESGFYNFVRSVKKYRTGTQSLLHCERNKKVEARMADQAFSFGLEHVYGQTIILDSLFEILVECMSNTHSHADRLKKGEFYWWLYVYRDPKQKIVSYTFVDRGVGIFKSATVQGFLAKAAKATGAYPKDKLVADLLAGKIKSRIVYDGDIRGKGIPFIVDSSQENCYKSFYLVTNDVKINLKDGSWVYLDHPLEGTLFHWELQNQ